MSLVSSMLLFNQKKKNPVLACVSFGNKTNHFSNGFLLHFHARKKKRKKKKDVHGDRNISGEKKKKKIFF
jgi:hypothetical protein